MQVYDRVVSAAEVRGIVGRDNVQVGHWKFEDETAVAGQPNRTARNAVEGGDMAVLAGEGSSFAAGGPVGRALRLTGPSGYAATSGPAVHTDQSFSAAAWVQLDADAPRDKVYTVLAQEGTSSSGFMLAVPPGERRQVVGDDARHGQLQR